MTIALIISACKKEEINIISNLNGHEYIVRNSNDKFKPVNCALPGLDSITWIFRNDSIILLPNGSCTPSGFYDGSTSYKISKYGKSYINISGAIENTLNVDAISSTDFKSNFNKSDATLYYFFRTK